MREEVKENGTIRKFVYNQTGGVVWRTDGNRRSKQSVGTWMAVLLEKVSSGGGTKAEYSSYYYSQDEQRSTVYLTDEEGEIKNYYRYDAFGQEIESQEEVENQIRYTGQQYDKETGQYYLRARYYNPVIGRFTQEDEYRGDGLNLYAYCGNNPVVYYDPSGYSKCNSKTTGNVTQQVVNEGNGQGANGLGELIGKGGNKEVYAYGKDKVFAIMQDGKPIDAIDKELNMLKQLDELGFPTVNAEKIIIDGKPGILMDKCAQESKSIASFNKAKRKVTLKDNADISLLNQNSINDLNLIKRKMASEKLKLMTYNF